MTRKMIFLLAARSAAGLPDLRADPRRRRKRQFESARGLYRHGHRVRPLRSGTRKSHGFGR